MDGSIDVSCRDVTMQVGVRVSVNYWWSLTMTSFVDG